MSGEHITLQFSEVKKLKVSRHIQKNVRVGVTDLFSKLPKSLGVIDGAISLRFFEQTPFTIDYAKSEVIIGSTPSSGEPASLKLIKDHEKLIAFTDVHNLGLFEIDTGNSLTVINLAQARKLGANLSSNKVKKVIGKNETGFPYVTYYTSIPSIKIKSSSIEHRSPTVAFKKLIHDGVLGNDFFKGRRVSFDIQNSRMFITPLEQPSHQTP